MADSQPAPNGCQAALCSVRLWLPACRPTYLRNWWSIALQDIAWVDFSSEVPSLVKNNRYRLRILSLDLLKSFLYTKLLRSTIRCRESVLTRIFCSACNPFAYNGFVLRQKRTKPPLLDAAWWSRASMRHWSAFCAGLRRALFYVNILMATALLT